MIANHQQFLVSLEQLQELELALASVKRDASSPIAFTIQATSVQKEICRIRHEIDAYLGVADLPIFEVADEALLGNDSDLGRKGGDQTLRARESTSG
jgi:hypothetical protein